MRQPIDGGRAELPAGTSGRPAKLTSWRSVLQLPGSRRWRLVVARRRRRYLGSLVFLAAIVAGAARLLAAVGDVVEPGRPFVVHGRRRARLARRRRRRALAAARGRAFACVALELLGSGSHAARSDTVAEPLGLHESPVSRAPEPGGLPALSLVPDQHVLYRQSTCPRGTSLGFVSRQIGRHTCVTGTVPLTWPGQPRPAGSERVDERVGRHAADPISGSTKKKLADGDDDAAEDGGLERQLARRLAAGGRQADTRRARACTAPARGRSSSRGSPPSRRAPTITSHTQPRSYAAEKA